MLRPRLRAAIVAVIAAPVLAVGGGLSAVAAQPPAAATNTGVVSAAGTYYPVPTHPLVAGRSLSENAPIHQQVLGVGRVPASGVSAVVVMLNASAPGEAALVDVYSGDRTAAHPGKIAVASGTTRSTMLTIPVGDSPDVVLTSDQPVTATADIIGFYAADDTVIGTNGASGGLQPIDPVVLADGRTDPKAVLTPGVDQSLAIDIDGAGPHTQALLLQVSAIDPASAGAVSVRPAGEPVPATDTVSFWATERMSGTTIVRVTPTSDGVMDVVLRADASAPVAVQVSLLGFYDDGALGPNLRYRPLAATQDLTLPATDRGAAASADPTGADRLVRMAVPESVAGLDTFALVATSRVSQGRPGDQVLVADPADPSGSRLAVSTGYGQTTTGTQTVVLAADNSFSVLPPTQGQLVLEVSGSFESYPAVTDPALKSWVDAVSAWQINASLG